MNAPKEQLSKSFFSQQCVKMSISYLILCSFGEVNQVFELIYERPLLREKKPNKVRGCEQTRNSLIRRNEYKNVRTGE